MLCQNWKYEENQFNVEKKRMYDFTKKNYLLFLLNLKALKAGFFEKLHEFMPLEGTFCHKTTSNFVGSLDLAICHYSYQKSLK